jgi:hypothetical protein
LIGNWVWLTASWWATVKLVLTVCVAPPVSTRAWTVTCSPSTKRCCGTKLSPVPVEYARRLPPWLPLCEPTTCTSETFVPAPPRKLIWVAGEASGVPGSGETVTALEVELTSAVGVSAPELAEEVPPHAPSAIAIVSARKIAPVVRLIPTPMLQFFRRFAARGDPRNSPKTPYLPL